MEITWQHACILPPGAAKFAPLSNRQGVFNTFGYCGVSFGPSVSHLDLYILLTRRISLALALSLIRNLEIGSSDGQQVLVLIRQAPLQGQLLVN